MSTFTTKHLGDAGEYFALSQFSFEGLPSAKMPDNWPEYDLAIGTKEKLKTVSVKTRLTSNGSFNTEHCKFNAKDNFDFIACIFVISREDIRSWIIPGSIAKNKEFAPKSKNQDYRRLSFKQLENEPGLKIYEDNWTLKLNP